MASSNSIKLRSTCSTIAFYLLFGALHEASHLICAQYALGINADLVIGFSTLLQILFGRQVHICTELLDNDAIAMIRHTGWMTSCLVAVTIHALLSRRAISKNVPSSSAVATENDQSASWQTILILTAYATALEALVTDLFQFAPMTNTNSLTSPSTMIFYCGNFGLIILNPMWLHHKDERGNCHSAMAILKDMIRTTMMRGAQSGGVVTFEPTGSESAVVMKATRSRVVNMKRTDLSERIIDQVQKDNRSAFRSSRQQVKTFSGHTRFATTSIANFDGTHPHRWSPRSMRKVCSMTTGTSTRVGVENYIMHNGACRVLAVVMNNCGGVNENSWLIFSNIICVVSAFLLFQVTLSFLN